MESQISNFSLSDGPSFLKRSAEKVCYVEYVNPSEIWFSFDIKITKATTKILENGTLFNFEILDDDKNYVQIIFQFLIITLA